MSELVITRGVLTPQILGATEVSIWRLDSNANDAKGISNGVFSGSVEIGLDGLQETGECVAFDGSSAKMVVPHAAAYALANWAIHLKMQPDTTPTSGNRVFFGKGTFLANGEISIEQRPDGLNAYVTGGGVASWQGPGGSANGVVPLPVGVACDILFQGGSGGTELWHRPAGGSWAMVGSSGITIGLNSNITDLYVGASPYGGGSAFFDGLIDEVSIWSRKLLAGDRALIPAPISRERIAGYDQVVSLFGADVVSYWKWADGTGADEQSVANAVVSGSPETGVPSILIPDPAGATCIAWTGADHAEAPHVAAHKTAAGTIVATFQRDTSSDKTIILAADSGTPVGGLSVEVLADGTPRAYWRVSAPTAIVAGSPGDIQVNRAYTMVFKWGGTGASMSVWDDAGVMVRRVSNTQGSATSLSTSPIRFGRWHTGINPHDGPYARIVWLSRRIADEEEPTLAQPKTVSRGVVASAVTLTAFQATRVQVTTLLNWPVGRKPQMVVAQGTHAHGYVRRAWKPTNNDGTWMDFQAGWRKASGTHTIRVRLDDSATEVDIPYIVQHTIPTPVGGTTRTLDKFGGGNFTDWNTAIAALQTNDVLVVRARTGGEVYTQDTNGGGPTSTASGVKIVAHPDDLAEGRRPRIHVRATQFARYADELNSGHWEVYQDLGSPHGKVWRTTAAVGALVNIGCSYRSQDGGLRRCFTYTNTPGTPGALARLTDTTYPRIEVLPDTLSTWDLYMGPGIYLHSDNKLYIRLSPITNSVGAKQVNVAAGVGPNPPWDWTDDGPANQDPNQCQLYISSSNNGNVQGVVTTNASYIIRINGTSNWTFENLDFVGGGDTIQMRGGSGHTLRGCRFLGWAPPNMQDDPNQSTVGQVHNMLECEGTFNVLAERCEFWGGGCPWVGARENKAEHGAYSIAHKLNLFWLLESHTFGAASASLRFVNCLIDGFMLLTRPGGTPQYLKYHQCSLRRVGMDGAHACQTPTQTLEFVRTQLFEASFGGWTGQTAVQGRMYVGYCLLNNFRPLFHGNAWWDNNETIPNQFCCLKPVIGHEDYKDCEYHYYYNNTSIGAHNHMRAQTTKAGTGGMLQDGGSTYLFPNNVNRWFKEFWSRNNILAVRPNGSLGTLPAPYSGDGDSHAGVVIHQAHVGNAAAGGLIAYSSNYNLYHRHASMPSVGANGVITTMDSAGTERIRNSITDVRTDTGQELNGGIGDPLFVGSWDATKLDRELHTNAFWCLQAGSPAATGGDTTDRGWIDLDFGAVVDYLGNSWRGCMDPQASAVEQQVGPLGPMIPLAAQTAQLTSYDAIVNSFGASVVSYWKFQNTGTDEKGLQNATITGSPELNVDTIVDLDRVAEGQASDGKCIAWTGTAGEFASAAHNAAYKTAAGTIALTFQRDSAPDKSVLLTTDATTDAGNLSIEINANGSLRAFLRDSTGVPVVITEDAVHVALGQAYTIFFKWGTPNLSLSLWNESGALVRRLTNPLTSGTTGNTTAIRFGSYPENFAHHDGPYGRVIWINRRITDDEEVLLARARTIQHAAPPVTTGLQVPRLDLWLTNDDMAIPSTGTVRYASPTGSGVGGTSPGAAGALQTTLSASAAGDTVVCLQGYYSASGGLTFPAGSSATSPVTVMAQPNTWAVICQDTSFLNLGQLDHAAGEGSAKTWTLHDAATNTWRIPYSGGASTLNGCYFQGGIAHMLFPYPSLTALMSARDSSSGGSAGPQTKNEYWFSGLAVSGGFAYIRLDRPNWRDMVSASNGAVDATYGAWPDDHRYEVGVAGGSTQDWFSRSNAADFKTGRPIIGQGLNPNNLRIYICGDNSARVLNQSSGSFTRMGSGMNSMGFQYYTTGKSNHELHRGCHFMRGFFVCTIDANVSNITAHRARIFTYGEHRLQGSMAVMKYDEFLSPPNQMLQGSHRGGLLIVPFNADHSATNVTFDNCTICYFHEVIEGDEPTNRIRFVNCTFHMVYDEWGQNANEKIAQLEVGWCYLLDSSLFNGGSGSGTGTQSPLSTEWYHHNIMDQRCPRSGFIDRKPAGGQQSVGRDISSSASTKRYNNTLILNPDCAAGEGAAYGWDSNKEIVGAPSSFATYEEFFNNIVIRHDTKRYNGGEGTAPKREDCAEAGMLIANTDTARNKCLRNSNLYYRSVPVDPATSAFTNKKMHGYSLRYFGTTHSFDYVRANTGLEPGNTIFFGSTHHGLTTSGIGYTWESNSSDADPQIPSVSSFPSQRMDYRPQNLSAVGASATPPSVANWWSSPGWTSYGAVAVPFNMAPSPWKGALDPSGATVPVGVQNP